MKPKAPGLVTPGTPPLLCTKPTRFRAQHTTSPSPLSRTNRTGGVVTRGIGKKPNTHGRRRKKDIGEDQNCSLHPPGGSCGCACVVRMCHHVRVCTFVCTHGRVRGACEPTNRRTPALLVHVAEPPELITFIAVFEVTRTEDHVLTDLFHDRVV